MLSFNQVVLRLWFGEFLAGGRIFIVLDQWNKSMCRHVASIWHINL